MFSNSKHCGGDILDIGQRIKQLRIQNDLTQEDLASRCELTKGFLSQLENNVATPSLTALQDIVEALGTNMSDFFREEKDSKVVFEKSDFFTDEEEDYTINWVVPNAQKNEMEPIIIEIKPHHSSFVKLPASGQEFGYVLSGKVTLVNGNRKYTVKKGSTFYIDSSKEHYLRNDSETTASILWISNPPQF